MMEVFLQVILPVIGALGVTAGTILFYKSNKRIKEAEATKAELDNLNIVVVALREEVKRIGERLTTNETHLKNAEARLVEKDALLGKLYRTIENLTTSLHLYAMAVAKGLLCPTPSADCPIRKELVKQGIDTMDLYKSPTNEKEGD